MIDGELGVIGVKEMEMAARFWSNWLLVVDSSLEVSEV